MEVVGCDAVARALGKECCEDDQKQPLPISFRLKEDAPALFRGGVLESDGLLDLYKFGLDEIVIGVPIGVILKGTMVSTDMQAARMSRPTFTKTFMASSPRSFEQSHLGLSGSSQMPTNWMKGMSACRPTGILQEALPLYPIVPYTAHAAMIDPTYQSVLYMVVMTPRCCGWASYRRISVPSATHRGL